MFVTGHEACDCMHKPLNAAECGTACIPYAQGIAVTQQRHAPWAPNCCKHPGGEFQPRQHKQKGPGLTNSDGFRRHQYGQQQDLHVRMRIRGLPSILRRLTGPQYHEPQRCSPLAPCCCLGEYSHRQIVQMCSVGRMRKGTL
jgi:hypothetical protein